MTIQETSVTAAFQLRSPASDASISVLLANPVTNLISAPGNEPQSANRLLDSLSGEDTAWFFHRANRIGRSRSTTSDNRPELKQVNFGAAAIDIGSKMHMAAVNPASADIPVRMFGPFTSDLHIWQTGLRLAA